MNRRADVVVLCEDQQQEAFARKYLECVGFHPRRIRPNTCPKGERSGEQYVREQYPTQVKTFRRQLSRRNVCLVVVTDADERTVKQRHDALQKALVASGQERRADAEPIAIFVPKRNIETWIRFAAGQHIDEKTVYPHSPEPGACREEARMLRRMCQRGLDETAPPSLHAACPEVARITK